MHGMVEEPLVFDTHEVKLVMVTVMATVMAMVVMVAAVKGVQ